MPTRETLRRDPERPLDVVWVVHHAAFLQQAQAALPGHGLKRGPQLGQARSEIDGQPPGAHRRARPQGAQLVQNPGFERVRFQSTPTMKLLSWNVNGVRAALRYGLLDYLARERADVVCLQETRAPVEALAPLMAAGYHVYLNPAERKGYAGVAILSRAVPRAVTFGMGLPEHDQEGRVVTAEFGDFFLVNVYVPNSKNDLARLPYRQRWDLAFLAYLIGLEQRKPVIFCGDLNVAHNETRPRASPAERRHARVHGGGTGRIRGVRAGGIPGFVPRVRAGRRILHVVERNQAARAHATSVGASTHFLLSASLRPRLRRAFIHPETTGSDHCPVGVEIDA